MTGQPLLPGIFANALVALEIAYGADPKGNPALWTWTDVTADLLEDFSIEVTVGRGDEHAQTSPATLTATFDNDTFKYTPYHPLSPNYPNLRRNTPVRERVSVDGGSTWFIRFQGGAVGFNPDEDQSSKFATSTLTAAGRLRNIAQGTKPLRSPLTRAILGADPANLHAYWAMEETAGAAQYSSTVRGGVPLAITGSVDVGAQDPAEISSVINSHFTYGTLPLSNFKNGGSASATFAAGSPTGWTVQVAGYVNPFSTADVVTVAEWITPGGTYSRWQLVIDTNIGGATKVLAIKPDGTTVTAVTTSFVNGAFGDFRIEASQSGGNIAVRLAFVLDDVSSSLTTATLAGVAGVAVNTSGTAPIDVVVGHVRVWDGILAPDFQVFTSPENEAWWAYKGESPRDRFDRLCTEEGIPFTHSGFYSTDVRMGPQTVDTLVNLLRQCADADIAFVYDGFGPGLTYQGISQRYDQITTLNLNIGLLHLAKPPRPVDDDQRTVNLITVTNSNGNSSVTLEQTDGPLGTDEIGEQPSGGSSVTLNVDPTEPQRIDWRAGWEVHAGTMPGFRYPYASIDMAISPNLTAWLNVLPGNKITLSDVDDITARLPPELIELVVEGWTETISTVDWTIDLNCTPSRIYDVFKIQASGTEAHLGRLQASASTLAANVAIGATSFTLATPAGSVLWTTTATHPGDFPMDLEISGMQVTVTGITGTSSPQTASCNSSQIKKALLAGEPVKVWHPGVIKY